MGDIGIGSIVQITDERHAWYSCLLIVTKVKSWGIQGYIGVPESNITTGLVGNAFNRFYYDQVTKVGDAVLIRE
jgi:hypothetical protein